MLLYMRILWKDHVFNSRLFPLFYLFLFSFLCVQVPSCSLINLFNKLATLLNLLRTLVVTCQLLWLPRNNLFPWKPFLLVKVRGRSGLLQYLNTLLSNHYHTSILVNSWFHPYLYSSSFRQFLPTSVIWSQRTSHAATRTRHLPWSPGRISRSSNWNYNTTNNHSRTREFQSTNTPPCTPLSKSSPY